MAKSLLCCPCSDCNGEYPPCNPCSDCGRCIYNQYFPADSDLDDIENWYENRVLEDEMHAYDATIEILQRENARLDREWVSELAKLAGMLPCEIDKKELAEIAKKPFSMECAKQVREIVKKHSPEAVAAIWKS